MQLVFFLELAGELCIIILRRRKRGKNPYNTHTHLTKKTNYLAPLPQKYIQPWPVQSLLIWHHSEEVIHWAPAKPHLCSFSLPDTRDLVTLGEAPSKTQRLRWFHKVQAPRTIRELRPFLMRAGAELELISHYSSKFIPSVQGERTCRPTLLKILNKNSRFGSVFFSHNHLILSAQFRFWILEIPRPPSVPVL